MTVCAVVVTHNRRALLGECLAGLRRQSRPVDQVIVVDNGSDDGTPELVRSEHPYAELAVLPANRGGAGGFAEGLRLARERGTDWIWLMDDDAEPRPDALESLLASPPAYDEDTVALCPKVVYPDGRIDRNQRGHFHRRVRPLPEREYRDGDYPELGYLSFVGSLVRASAVRELELPRADFFLWGDDVEYSFRLRALGRIVLVPESVIVHKRAIHSYSTRRSRLLSAVLPVTLRPTPPDRFWQSLFGLRNYLWIKRAYEGQTLPSAAGTTLQFVAKALLCEERPLRRIPWIVRYAARGRRGDFDNSLSSARAALQ